ncbi:MAG: ribonuclease HII, partial [Patescibacteria group bacterium]|nr:ribonuclease HII [Patescibacteria group bacterium]
MKYSNFSLEYSLLEHGSRYVAGMDEVGRGCLAGPVVAAIVVISSDGQYIPGVLDSKLMTRSRREKMYTKIIDVSNAVGVGECSHQVIDKIGIVKATELAMQKAYQNLIRMPEIVL